MDCNTKYAILGHGNCIDGWFASYILHSALTTKHTGQVDISMYAISPNAKHTWPADDALRGKHVYFIDVSVPKEMQDTWIINGALSMSCIDHHITTMDHWTHAPHQAIIDTSRCATYLTWLLTYPGQPIPEWVLSIDRIDRWDTPTLEDRCLREILSIISHLPVQGRIDDAFSMTQNFFTIYNDPTQRVALLNDGLIILQKKEADLLVILQEKGRVVCISDEEVQKWKLPDTWNGVKVFLMDTTGISIDTTEASHIVFQKSFDVNVFINYRSKKMKPKHGKNGGRETGTMYTYSARSQGFNLIADGIFQGHPTSAGSSKMKSKNTVLPFLL